MASLRDILVKWKCIHLRQMVTSGEMAFVQVKVCTLYMIRRERLASSLANCQLLIVVEKHPPVAVEKRTAMIPGYNTTN